MNRMKKIVKNDVSGTQEEGLKLKIGNLCFRFRAISVVPFVLISFYFFYPLNFGNLNTIINIIGFIVSLTGATLRILSVGFSKPKTSGRENYLIAEALNTSGTYSIVRNPLYVGNFLIYNGILIAYSSLLAFIVLNIFFIINYYFIIFAEEDYLKKKFGDKFIEYLGKVPKVIPKFGKYKKNDYKFQPVKVLFKEKNTNFYWITLFVIALLLKQYRLNNGIIDHFWYYAIPVLVLFFLNVFLTILKKVNPPENI